MKKEIKCPICGTLLGTIEKEVITDADIMLYQGTTKCNSHDTPCELVDFPEET
jgi:hypothetical protein